jgi:hypothetical protein
MRMSHTGTVVTKLKLNAFGIKISDYGWTTMQFFFHSYTVHLDTIKVFYLPTDAH